MIINNIKLYKTPLDSSYANVFDSYSTVNEYEEFLKEYYQYLELDLTQNKSIRTTDGFAEIVLPYYQSSVRDYNYLQITSNGLSFFYFIIGTQSLDDGNTPSTRMSLKWDAWANNYRYSSLKGSVLRSTDSTSRVYIDGNDNYIYSINRAVETLQFKIRRTTIGSASQLYSNNENYVVLWLRLRMYKDLYTATSYNNVNGVKTPTGYDDLRGCIYSQITTPIIYMPLCIVNPLTRKIVKPYSIQFFNSNGPHAVRYPVGDKGGIIWYDLNAIVNEKPAILNADLTFLPPFTYEVNEVDVGVIEIVPNADYGLVYTAKDPLKFLELEINNDLGQYEHRPTTFVYGFSDIGQKTHNFKPFTNIVQNISPASINKNINKLYEGALLSYPFRYYELYVNGAFMPISFPYFIRNCRLTIDTVATANAKFKLEFGNEQNPFSNIQIGSFALIRTDQLESYLATNGERLGLERANALLSSGASVAKAIVAPSPNTIIGAVSSVEGSLLSLVGIQAKLKDLDNAPDAFNTTSANALDDMLYQDDILFYDCDIYDDYIANALYDDIHMYGIQSGGYADFKSNAHYTYDFVKGELIPNSIKNYNDRIELQAAFMQGITKWHIDAINDIMHVVDMDRNTINIEKEVYNVL